MGDIRKYYFLKWLETQKNLELPPLLSGLKEIPFFSYVSVATIVIHHVIFCFYFGWYSFLSLTPVFIGGVVIIPILTYICVYNVIPEGFKENINPRKVKDFISRTSVFILISTMTSVTSLFFGFASEINCFVLTLFFLIFLISGFMLFSSEVSVLSESRDMIMAKVLGDGHGRAFPDRIKSHYENTTDINPASGFPMYNPSIDVLGNPRGVELNNISEQNRSTSYDYESINSVSDVHTVNPASGMPMMDRSVDVLGNPMGVDLNNSYHMDINSSHSEWEH